jgi:hypothetical protein
MGTIPLLWPILACACGITGIAAVKVYQLFVRRERSTMRLHSGLRFLVFLGAGGVVLGSLAALLGLQRLTTALAGAPGEVPAPVALAERAGSDATLLALGLLVAFGAGIVWFVLVNRIGVIERTESAALLALE